MRKEKLVKEDEGKDKTIFLLHLYSLILSKRDPSASPQGDKDMVILSAAKNL